MILPNTPIITANQTIKTKGKVFYTDRRRRIDLKKPIRDLFEHSNYEVFYVMELCLSKDAILNRVSSLSEKRILPVLLYFVVGDRK